MSQNSTEETEQTEPTEIKRVDENSPIEDLPDKPPSPSEDIGPNHNPDKYVPNDHPPRHTVDEERFIEEDVHHDDIPTVAWGYYCNGKKVKKDKGFVGYCNNRAGFKTDHPLVKRCKYHGGARSPEFDHPNWSPGAPKNNDNGQTHGLQANRTLFYDRLDDERKEMVDEFERALIQRYVDNHGREPDAADVQDVFEIAVGYVLRDHARDWLVEQMDDSGNPMLEHVKMTKEDGSQVEFNKPNSVLEEIENMRREDRMQRKDKGLENDPGSQKADALKSITQMMRENVNRS